MRIIGPGPANLDEIGIKAAALNHLLKIGFAVPKYRIVTASFFMQYCSLTDVGKKMEFLKEEISNPAELGREVNKLILDTRMPEQLIDELAQAVRELRADALENIEDRFAMVVRSSRTYVSEHNSHVRFGIRGVDALESSVREQYAAHFLPAAIEERKGKGMPVLHLSIPIIVQAFVRPDVTGIIAPTGKDTFYIVAWPGFGHHMDFLCADHYVVRHVDRVLERFLNNQSGEMFFFDEQKASITRTKMVHIEAQKPFLTHDQIIELCETYEDHRDNLGGLGIEFTIHGAQLNAISLKDAKFLDDAERALEQLKHMKDVPMSGMDAAMPDEVAASKTVMDVDHPSGGSEQDTPIMPDTAGIMPNAPLFESQSVQEDVREEISSASDEHIDDTARRIVAVIDKYIAINPALEKQFSLLKEDILREL